MGNSSSQSAISSPTQAPIFTPPPVSSSISNDQTNPEKDSNLQNPTILEETGPGTFEELHRRTKDVFPTIFEGAKLVINKGLSNHFQISHNLTMSSLQPSGYKFGCTYVGQKQFKPTESYPVMMGEIDPSGNLSANIIHHFTQSIRCKFVSQVQNHKWIASQLTTDYKAENFVASVTLGNIDIFNKSGIIVGQYLHGITRSLAMGIEILHQFGPTIPDNAITLYTLGSRYTGDNWQVSGSLVPQAGGLHLCYHHKITDTLQFGVEYEGSLRTQESTTTIGYQMEIPKADVTFRGQLDSNLCVSGVLEKKLQPLPFTFVISAFANHNKPVYRFGVGLIVG